MGIHNSIILLATVAKVRIKSLRKYFFLIQLAQ